MPPMAARGELVLLEPGGERVLHRRLRPRSMSTFLRRYSHRMAGVSCVRCGVREDSGFGVRLEIVDLDGSSRLLRSIVWLECQPGRLVEKSRRIVCGGPGLR